MQANSRQLICLKSLLNIFADSIGLKVNYHKSIKVPLNVDDERLSHFTNTLHCKKKEISLFTYLGLPLGITKPSLEYFLPMVTRVERRLCGIADFLNYEGKMKMVKSMLASLPKKNYGVLRCASINYWPSDKIHKTMSMKKEKCRSSSQRTSFSCLEKDL
jgi:hypothetical protein